jgi:ribosomal protein S27E
MTKSHNRIENDFIDFCESNYNESTALTLKKHFTGIVLGNALENVRLNESLSMDIVFKCTHCDQEMSVDSSGAGTQINCPSCGQVISIPEVTQQNIAVNPMATSAAAKEEKHFMVPQHTAAAPLIEKPKPPLEAAAKGEKGVRVKTIKHGDCVEVGKDRFDDITTDFLQKIGQDNLISITAVSYSHTDAAGKTMFNDFGVVIIYKG